MIKIEHNLSATDFRLYDFLKKQGDNWTTQKEIALALPDVFPCTLEDMQDFHNAPVRHQITNSIRRLNESGYITRVILSGAKGVKIANEQEFSSYISSNILSTVNKLKRLKKIAEKGNKHNQYKLVLNGKEKDIFEAFINIEEE